MSTLPQKQCSTLSPVLFPLVDLRPAYPLAPSPNGLELRKQNSLLVQPAQVTQKPCYTHPPTCISSNLQFCYLACSLLSFSFSFSSSTKTHNPFRSQEA